MWVGESGETTSPTGIYDFHCGEIEHIRDGRVTVTTMNDNASGEA